jgi:hypothetical protein
MVNPLVPATTNLPVGNQLAPIAVVLVDPVSGNQLTGATGIPVSGGTGATPPPITQAPLPVAPAANYTAISTNGTTTVKGTPGIYYGASLIAAGTAATMQAFDGTTPITAVSTGSLGVPLSLFPAGIGVKFATSLVVVSAGTAAGTWLNLWD